MRENFKFWQKRIKLEFCSLDFLNFNKIWKKNVDKLRENREKTRENSKSDRKRAKYERNI